MILVAGLTLVEHLTGKSLGIDTLLFHRDWGQNAATAPMRMGIPAISSFLMIGLAMLLFCLARPPRAGGAALLGVMVVAIAMLSVIGYLYGAHQMYSIPRVTAIALQTASVILILGIGVIASAPQRNPMRSLLQPGTAGMLARRALPVLFVLSLSLGWVRIWIERERLVDTEFGTALRTLVELALLSGLLWWAVGMVGKHEAALVESEGELREAKEAAEAANIAKDNFVATLSHELRTPLTPVLATLSAWEKAPEFPPSLRDEMQMVRRNIDLEARLIDDLLDLTGIVRGKFTLNLETLDVHELMRTVVSMYRGELETGRFKVTQRLEAANCIVRGDPGRLQQVFWNVLKNAVKFTPGGGQIELSTRNDAQGHVQVLVRDSGLGISAEALTRLFRPFEQGSDEIVKRYGGLGLGLTIARSLLIAHGGEIAAQSDGLGRGATFILTLPFVASKPVKPVLHSGTPAKSNGAAQGRTFRLLLVEDHADTARVLARLLGSNGHTVEVASSVREAMEAFNGGGKFDFLVSDVGLPDGSGVDLIRQIRQQLGLGIPAIALSGYGMEEDIARCKEAGFDDHVTKPVNLQKLEATIQRVAAATAGEDGESRPHR